MRLLLDTHIAIWAALDPAALSEAERRVMRNADSPLVLSAVSVWELRLKWQSFDISGKRKGPISPDAIINFAMAVDWVFLPLTPRHAVAALSHKLAHKDPFDEILLVQAQEEGLQLLTRDSKLSGHPRALAPG